MIYEENSKKYKNNKEEIKTNKQNKKNKQNKNDKKNNNNNKIKTSKKKKTRQTRRTRTTGQTRTRTRSRWSHNARHSHLHEGHLELFVRHVRARLAHCPFEVVHVELAVRCGRGVGEDLGEQRQLVSRHLVLQGEHALLACPLRQRRYIAVRPMQQVCRIACK